MSVTIFNALLLAVLVGAGTIAFSKKRIASAIFAAFSVLLYVVAAPVVFAVLGTILLLIVIGTPLFVTVGLLTLVCYYFGADEYQHFDSYELIIEEIFTLTDKNVLLAIPFFVVAGSLMTAGGIARRLVDLADALIGWLPGGLAAASVLACIFFAAISGSSPTTVIAIGTIMMPALVKHGYDDKFSLGLVTSAGSLGILIPPSIPMIIYAIMVGGIMAVNVADLFLAGLIPGFVIGGLLIGYSVYHGMSRPDFSWSKVQAPSLKLVGQRFVRGIWALLLPVLVLGGIYPIFGPRGIFTATEAAAVAVVYALVIELFIHRELQWKKIPGLLRESAVLMGSLLGILIMSFALNKYLVDQSIPDAAVEWMSSLDLTRLSFLVLLNIFLLLIGCLMDIISAIMIVAPLVAPIAASFGINPIHLGIIFVVNLEIGYLTPPIGINLFVSATLFKRPIGFVMRSVIPFMLLMLIGLMLITWFEPISGGLPRLMAGKSFVAEDPPPAPPKRARGGDLDDLDDLEDLDDTPTATTGSSGVMTIQELMKASGVTADDDDEDEDDLDDESRTSTPADDDDRVKSIQELMREQGISE